MAWVIVAVVTAPVDMPMVSAISQSVVTALVFWSSQLSSVAVWSSPMTSLIGLHAGGHRHRARRRIGDLRVGGIGLGGREMREGLPGQHVEFAVDAALLALEDARGGDGREAHAVADDQDDVLGLVGVALLRQDALQCPAPA